MGLLFWVNEGSEIMRILFIGDIVGKNGRNCVSEMLPKIRKKYQIDFVIANGENATHGKGLIENHYHKLIDSGVDVVTLGNHWNSKSEIEDYINGAQFLVRPANLKDCNVGYGTAVYEINGYTIRVTNLLGLAFLNEEVYSPYDVLKNIVENEERADIHIVDYHAEATGEKQSLAWAFDGKISALIGTHTHVQTRDARILTEGTGYMSDVGMCGPYNGVLGCKKEAVINRTWLGKNEFFEVDDKDESLFSGVVLDIDDSSGLTNEIIPIYLINNHK